MLIFIMQYQDEKWMETMHYIVTVCKLTCKRTYITATVYWCQRQMLVLYFACNNTCNICPLKWVLCVCKYFWDDSNYRCDEVVAWTTLGWTPNQTISGINWLPDWILFVLVLLVLFIVFIDYLLLFILLYIILYYFMKKISPPNCSYFYFLVRF